MPRLMISLFSQGQTIPLKYSHSNVVVETRRTYVEQDMAEDSGSRNSELFVRQGLRSLITVPLISKDRVMATFTLSSLSPNAYGPKEQDVLERLAAQITPAVENSLLFQEIRRLSEFNDRIIDSTPTALAVLKGKDRVVTAVNRSFCQMFATDVDTVVGEPVMRVPAITALAHLFDGWALWRSENEGCYIGPDGGEHWLRFSVRPLIAGADAEAGTEALLSAEDITDQKQQQEKLQETARLASIGELAAGVAHEINNPLTGVLGFAQLLMTTRKLSRSVTEDVQTIYDQALRASKVVDNLRSFARRHPPEKRLIDVRESVATAVALKVHDFSLANIAVIFDFPVDIPSTLGDDHQLQQVFLNIIVNAQQAMTEAHRAGTLSISVRQVGDNLRLSFADDGPGIPPHQLKKVFDPFFTTKEVGKGTGLGLSICYGIVREHGGAIWVESQEGAGATIYVELPILNSEEEQRSQEPDGSLSLPDGQRILVVDDEPVVRDLLSRALSADGHMVDLARDGQDAIEKVGISQYDCIVVDLRMPGIDGQEFYGLISQLDPDLSRKVIFITGDTARAEARDFLESTGNLVLGKPFDLDELRRHIGTVVLEQD